jgi:hypothetical protein
MPASRWQCAAGALTVMSHDGLVSAAPLAVNGMAGNGTKTKIEAEDRS